MKVWFECTAKYQKIDSEGREKKATEVYLLDALSFSEAEARIFKELEEMIRGEFDVVKVAKSNISEVIPSETGDRWFKCKLTLITIDEQSGKEKKANEYSLVLATDAKDAYDKVVKSMDGIPVDFEIPTISESAILDVFPYTEKATEEILESKEETNGEE